MKSKTDDIMNFDLPVERSSIIKVIGIGDGGNNAVNHMYEKGIKDVNFVVCNTDHQALARSPVPIKVQIGESITEGRGAGTKPEVGRQAAMENIKEVMDAISGNTKMVFLTTGMGGGTGTGAIPVIAKACKDAGLLTIAVVTIPFKSEGKIRINYAIDGITELKDYVDSLLVINNEKLREIYGDQGVSTAFAKADDILTTAVKGIAEIITVAGYINVDFEDVETVMRDSGVAIMGMGMAAGEDRALKAIENALASPLLGSNDITEAKSILVNILSGMDANELTMDELGQITDYMYEATSEDALIIRGLSQNGNLGENISITLIATGFPSNSIFTPYKKPKPKIVEKLKVNIPVPHQILPDKGENDFTVHPKSSKSVIDDIDEKEKPEATLKKVKHMQNFFKKEDLSNKIIKENIENFEDVPAYIRKKINIQSKEEKKESEESMGTPQPDEEKEPVLIENNPYLNTLEKKEVKTDKTNLKKIKNEQKAIKKGNIIKKNIKNDYNDLKDIPVKIGQKKFCEPGEKRTRSNSDSTLQKDNEVQEIDFQKIEKQVFDNINESNPYDFNHGIESGFQDLVYSSVFAPEHVIRDKNFLILVFIHTRDQKAEVKSLASNFDKTLIQKAFQYLDLSIKIGTRLTFELILNNIFVEENKKTMVWLGDPSYIDFEFIIPESFKEEIVYGKVIICIETIPVGTIKFRMNIEQKRSLMSNVFAETKSSKYRNAFISYSSHDRKEVIKRINLLSKLDVNYFWDLMTLRPGDRWRNEIYKYIEKSDVFFLFWSSFAKKSNWVKREWEYALDLKGHDESKPPDIIPIVIEGPPPPKPPKPLCHLHFNDPMIYFEIE